MLETLVGKVAIVTGAATGIGKATCGELAKAGAQLVLVGRRAELLEHSVAEFREAGCVALAVSADVSSFDQMVMVVDRTMAQFGRIDIFVANAGVVDRTTIHEADPGLWRQVIETNALGVMFGVRAVLPHMYVKGSGHIVIVSSASGRVTYVGEPAYVTSKHASVAFGNVLRQEAGPRGVCVTLVEPGLVDTPLIHQNRAGAQEIVKGVEPLRPEDCARIIRFAVEQPPNCCINEVVVRPTAQQL